MLGNDTKPQRKQVMEKLGSCLDLHHQILQLCGLRLEMFALSSLVDIAATAQRLLEAGQKETGTWEELQWKIGAEEADPHEDLVQGILEGRTVILKQDGTGASWIQSEPRKLNRSVDTPINQNIMVSSQTGFIEDHMTNLGLVRNELRSSYLRQSYVTVGSVHKKRIILLSLESAAVSTFVEDCEAALRSHESKEFTSIQQVAGWLCRQPAWSPIPSYVKTESPHETAHYLKKGRVVLLIEGYPEAIVIPVQLPDLFMSDTDRDYPAVTTAMIVLFRILGSLIAIVAPAAYVALVSVNPDVMKLELIYSIAQSRVGVPYPSITEALILLFIIEMLFEAIIRLPKSIGPAMTMVGGIILGQAVVEANLVSNLLIIVIAASTIANFTIIGYHFALAVRLWRYIMLFFATLFGPLGIVCGLYLLLSLISVATVMRKPFVPLAPTKKRERVE